MVAKDILGLVPTMQSIAIAGHSYRMTKPAKPKKMLKNIIHGTTGILVGIPIMKTTATQIAGF